MIIDENKDPYKIVSDKDEDEYKSDTNTEDEDDDNDDDDERNDNSDDDQTLVYELPNEGLVPTKANASDAALKKEVTDTSLTINKHSSVSCIENTTIAEDEDENEKFKEIIDNGLSHVDTECENKGKEIVEISRRNSTGSFNKIDRYIESC